MSSHHGRGFTLVELLVVISIIALLLSILMPSLGKAKGYAKRIVCSSNIRQSLIGIHMYCEDYSKMPPGTFSYRAKYNLENIPSINRGVDPGILYWFADKGGWLGQRYSYIGQGILYGLEYLPSHDVLFCPGLDPKTRKVYEEVSDWSVPKPAYYYSFGKPQSVSSYFYREPGYDTNPDKIQNGKFEVLLFDQVGWHKNGINLGILDGHVESCVGKPYKNYFSFLETMYQQNGYLRRRDLHLYVKDNFDGK